MPFLLTFFLVCIHREAIAEMIRSSHPPITHPSVRKGEAASAQEQLTVWGRRKLFLSAPVPNSHLLEPGDQTGFGPGSKLGIATVEGGPIDDQIHYGVAAGLAIPMPGMRNLDFTLTATGSRDAISASGTNGAASATAGLRLKF